MKLGDVTKTKNPLSTSGRITSPSDWVGQAMWFAMLGASFILGAKILGFADKFVPGSFTPANYANATAVPNVGSGIVKF